MTRHKALMVLAGTMVALGARMPLAVAAPTGGTSLPAGWEVVTEFDSCTTLDFAGQIYAVTATGPDNAWAAGHCGGGEGPGPDSALVAHWDGTSWRMLHPLADSQDASAVASLTGSYAWAFVKRFFEGPLGEDFAMLWQNGRWRRFRLADGSGIDSAVAFSRSNAWGFGFDGGAYAVRFNGHSWRRVPIPVAPLATAALGPANIWAIGPPSRTAGAQHPTSYTLAHWTGRWQAIPFPPLNLPSGTYLNGAWVALAGRGSVFVAVNTASPTRPGGQLLLRWDGHRWQNVTLPIQVLQLGPLAQDGHGGLWVTANPAVPKNPDFNVAMLHLSAAGKWSQTVVPIAALALNAMRLIPGTTSVWAGGFVASDCNPDSCLTPVIVHGP